MYGARLLVDEKDPREGCMYTFQKTRPCLGAQRAIIVADSATLSPSGQSFPKCHRLLRRHEFLWVQRKGKRYNVDALIACVCRTPEQATRVGITTSKKVGNAVMRNRLRRLIREAVRRLLLPTLQQGFAVVLIAKNNLARDLPQSRIDAAVEQLISQLQENPPRVTAGLPESNRRQRATHG